MRATVTETKAFEARHRVFHVLFTEELERFVLSLYVAPHSECE